MNKSGSSGSLGSSSNLERVASVTAGDKDNQIGSAKETLLEGELLQTTKNIEKAESLADRCKLCQFGLCCVIILLAMICFSALSRTVSNPKIFLRIDIFGSAACLILGLYFTKKLECLDKRLNILSTVSEGKVLALTRDPQCNFVSYNMAAAGKHKVCQTLDGDAHLLFDLQRTTTEWGDNPVTVLSPAIIKEINTNINLHKKGICPKLKGVVLKKTNRNPQQYISLPLVEFKQLLGKLSGQTDADASEFLVYKDLFLQAHLELVGYTSEQIDPVPNHYNLRYTKAKVKSWLEAIARLVAEPQVYLDIKPGNSGFDNEDQCKLFDLEPSDQSDPVSWGKSTPAYSPLVWANEPGNLNPEFAYGYEIGRSLAWFTGHPLSHCQGSLEIPGDRNKMRESILEKPQDINKNKFTSEYSKYYPEISRIIGERGNDDFKEGILLGMGAYVNDPKKRMDTKVSICEQSQQSFDQVMENLRAAHSRLKSELV